MRYFNEILDVSRSSAVAKRKNWSKWHGASEVEGAEPFMM